MAMASLDKLAFVIFRQIFLLGYRRSWYRVFPRSPISQVDQTAALAAEGSLGVAQGNFLFADRTLHTPALILTRSVGHASVTVPVTGGPPPRAPSASRVPRLARRHC